MAIGDYLGVSTMACIGGTNVRQDMDKLRNGVQLVVGYCYVELRRQSIVAAGASSTEKAAGRADPPRMSAGRPPPPASAAAFAPAFSRLQRRQARRSGRAAPRDVGDVVDVPARRRRRARERASSPRRAAFVERRAARA